LVSRRASPPPVSASCGYAGALASERRNVDFPDVVRQTSLEHVVHRRHSAPAQRYEAPDGNLVIRFSSIGSDADLVGRSPSASPSPPTSPSLPVSWGAGEHTQARAGRRRRSRSPGDSQSPTRSHTPPARSLTPRGGRKSRPAPLTIFPLQSPRTLGSSSSCPFLGATWGEEHAFTGAGTGPESTATGTFNEEEAEVQVGETPTYSDRTLSPSKQVVDNWSSRWSDEDRSMTPTTHGGLLSSFSSGSVCLPSSFYSCDTVDVPGHSAASNVMTFAKTVDKHYAKIYERRLKAMVKDAQKKALKRVA